MTSDETTTNNVNLNLPGIGIRTDWASQYRENFIILDELFSGQREADSLSTQRLEGGVTGGALSGVTNLQGQNLSVDDNGNLNATETTGTAEVVAHTRRRVTTPVGGA